MILPVLKEKASYCTILETYCQEVSRKLCIFYICNNILTVEQEPMVQAQWRRGTGRIEERTPSAGPAPRSLTAALWAAFRREGAVLPCLTTDARQIARTRADEGHHIILSSVSAVRITIISYTPKTNLFDEKSRLRSVAKSIVWIFFTLRNNACKYSSVRMFGYPLN